MIRELEHDPLGEMGFPITPALCPQIPMCKWAKMNNRLDTENSIACSDLIRINMQFRSEC